ncbi:shikimate dehydrogenase [Nocardioides sp. CFH 31398]|uniref:shikimate dehydrogenase n=1 Tax=Nocardioides sp. CFH 31398 TaxID=2919579 RepID=UPI001F055165|nr:shikimate dehydrogenase [Nocardioides sp. CFH 31398]MCH1867900.1 shikimate dehydrogenase [Nocardioides sp. CFH 31398]
MDHPYLVGLIGAGVRPSLTPPLHMAEARALGLTYVYRPVDLVEHALPATAVGDLLAQARVFGFDALNVTHPCKQLVLEHLDELSPAAAALGAVNTVLLRADGTTIGHNTDTTGFETAVATGLPGADLAEVVMLGAGGAGAAVAAALARLGTEHLVVVDVDVDRATALAADVAATHAGLRVEAADPDKLSALLPAATGLVHCTPTGMADHPGLPLDPTLLHPGLWVADIVYRPLVTALLTAARAAGCRTLDGGHMAVAQAVDAFRLITGLEPDADRMSAHLRDLVARGA